MKRFASHQAGTAKCKYTQSFKPLKIAQSWEIKGTKALAMRVEREIKKLSRAEKQRLIDEPSCLKMDEINGV